MAKYNAQRPIVTIMTSTGMIHKSAEPQDPAAEAIRAAALEAKRDGATSDSVKQAAERARERANNVQLLGTAIKRASTGQRVTFTLAAST